MTIVLDVSFDDTQQESERSQSDNNRKKVKHNACSSKAIKVAKAKYKVSDGLFFFLLCNTIIKIASTNCYYLLRFFPYVLSDAHSEHNSGEWVENYEFLFHSLKL